MSDDLSDDALLSMVVKADEELFAAGEDIRQRQFRVPSVVMRQLGYVSFGLFGDYTSPILKRIRAQFARLYSAHDLAVGGHIGVFMFRDIFGRIGIPHGYGTVRIVPIDHVELTDVQKHILASDSAAFDAYHDQFADLFDLEYGVRELRAPYAQMELVERFLNLSRLHLHGAAAILTGGYDFRGAVQSGLLATELALKALAAATGLGENDIRDGYGHHIDRLINYLEPKWSTLDAARVRRVTEAQPRYVRNRYAKEQPKRVEVGHTVMGAQFVAGEVTRQLSDRDFRKGAGQP
ncbi:MULTISPECIES: hypothetical protein [Bradyrhizobium]|uniref:hypothetical protein n=1 Tax=Bradyrhizobium TaxID=374 RepID=UPI0004890A64|nr:MULTISPECIES: hypothetical protein [Bradyrhizobium]QOG22255.1 hypothetical protein FOM02_38165 [Bradyrhizobium sp. SEMIA]UFW50027.1 hypothetical protein BaraCB756_02770 [Bradyrhizobium arachidis]